MLIKEKELNSIKQNKVTLVKNFITLEKKYDFNLISNLIEENELIVFSKTTYGNLKDVFQILKEFLVKKIKIMKLRKEI